MADGRWPNEKIIPSNGHRNIATSPAFQKIIPLTAPPLPRMLYFSNF
jgi:hypothetical protein